MTSDIQNIQSKGAEDSFLNSTRREKQFGDDK